jgi:transcriptional regulator with XRE-family HTH domain
LYKENLYNLSTYMSFGQWLVAARRAANLTQTQLAERLDGISASYISALEREEPNSKDGSPRLPRMDKVDRIAKALRADVNEARLAAGYAPQSNQTDIHDVLRGVTIMFQDESGLDNEQRAKIMELVKVIAAGVIAESQNK